LQKKTYKRIVVDEATQSGRSPFDALRDKVKELGLRYYPEENVFPLTFLISKLEQEAFEFSQKGAGPERGWLFKTLKEIKVPYQAIFNCLHDLFETKVYLI
jgi:nuclear pore complex protein Nup155